MYGPNTFEQIQYAITEAIAIIPPANDLHKSIIEVILQFGFRVNEAVERNRWSNMGAGIYIVATEKGGYTRTVALNSEHEIFKNYLNGSYVNYQFVTYSSVAYVFQKAMEGNYFEVGTKIEMLHSARHAKVKQLTDEGWNAEEIKIYLGLANILNVDEYRFSEVYSAYQIPDLGHFVVSHAGDLIANSDNDLIIYADTITTNYLIDDDGDTVTDEDGTYINDF